MFNKVDPLALAQVAGQGAHAPAVLGGGVGDAMMEVYWAYSDYEDMMNLAEELIRNAARAIGPLQIEWQGVPLDLEKPFRRVTMLDMVRDHTGVDFRGVRTDDSVDRKSVV